MRAFVCALAVATFLAAQPALAQADRSAASFWKDVQVRCSATALKPNALGQKIARNAIDEFTRFGGHRIDSNGELFRFGLTEAEHEQEDNGHNPHTRLADLGWWQVLKYWRALYGEDFAARLEVRGYRDGSTSPDEAQALALLRTTPADLMRGADTLPDPKTREILREAALRAAIIDTPWSAAFVSYVIKQAGVAPNAFHFSNAHRDYIYDAFATSAAEGAKGAGDRIYRACPLDTTRPRVGDLICHQREPALADDSAGAVRERIRGELAGNAPARTVRRTHCDVIAHIDAGARKIYVVSGNVGHAVTVRKLNLRRDLKFSAMQKGNCGGPGQWTLPEAAGAPEPSDNCSLNDKKWFVLLQLR